MRHHNGRFYSRRHPYRKRIIVSIILLLLVLICGQAVFIYWNQTSSNQTASGDPDSGPDPDTSPDAAEIPDKEPEAAAGETAPEGGDSDSSTSAGTEPDADAAESDPGSGTDTDSETDPVTGTEETSDNIPDNDTADAEADPDAEEEISFENTLFIGDSRTEGLLINTGLTEATFYAVRGLAVDNIYTKQFIREDGSSTDLTVMDALKRHSWRKIYIMLGVNELGWPYEELFIEQYARLVEDIKDLQPDAEIVVQSILPVTKEKSDNDTIYNNKKIYRYNELIQAMTEDEEVTYADLLPAIVDEDGALPAKGAVDGVHLTKSYYLKWLDYLISQKF